MSTELPAVEKEVAEVLHASAIEQANVLNNTYGVELFKVYPVNSQRPELDFLRMPGRAFGYKHNRAVGHPLESTVEELDWYGVKMIPGYDGLPTVFRRSKTVNTVAELVRGGNSVAWGNSHGALLDVPADINNVSCRLRERDVDHHTAMIVGKNIDYLALNVPVFGGSENEVIRFMLTKGARLLPDDTIPARDALSRVVDRIYFTFPMTASFLHVLEDEKAARHVHGFNVKTRRAIGNKLSMSGRGSLVLGIGMTGTKIKQLDTEEIKADRERPEDMQKSYDFYPEDVDLDKPVRVVGKVGSGTVKLVRGMYLFLNATDLNPGTPKMDTSEPIFMDGKHDDEDAGKMLVELEKKIHPDEQTVYDRKGNLPTTRNG